MDKFQDKTLFFYGTLRSREVREAVLDQQANNLILIDAYIKGYKLFKVKNTNYPLIISDPLSKNRIVLHRISKMAHILSQNISMT